MQAKEALHVLGLGADATQDDIKAAFRDLVKVWHPDRFGSDLRLREKAERRLQDINAAYATLRDGVPTDIADTNKKEAGWRPSPSPSKTAETRVSMTHVLAYSLAGVLCAAVFGWGWFLLQQLRTQTGSESPAPQVQQAPSTPVNGATGSIPEKKVSPPIEPHSTEPSRPQFRILTEAETAQVETQCAKKRRAGNFRAYDACVQNQLEWSKKYGHEGSALTAEERESLASTCSSDRARRDNAEYARCVAFYKEELETASIRPNLATVRDSDRISMQRACATHKTEGPATYDRCLMRMVKLLTLSR